VGAGYPPFSPELDCGESAGLKLAGHDERGYFHLVADVGDGEPFLWQVDRDAFHFSVSHDLHMFPK
jgi:hypothetical protein